MLPFLLCCKMGSPARRYKCIQHNPLIWVCVCRKVWQSNYSYSGVRKEQRIIKLWRVFSAAIVFKHLNEKCNFFFFFNPKVMSGQHWRFSLGRNGFQIYFLLSVFKYVLFCIIIYVIWRVLPPDNGIVCSLCRLKGNGTWHWSVSGERWAWRVRCRGQGEERLPNVLPSLRGQSTPTQLQDPASGKLV